ncbi:hypothetical protein M7I_8258 [Glarea lozoyensis 74030]|nr:hypothetical protein M7I_8258 [Glarea lozoyensis 74030]
MAIQMIALRNEHAAFTRRADAKIGLLKEIIERIKNGENVDVEGLLGTGDAQREKEWEEVLQEIEEEDRMWQEARGSKSKQVNQPEDLSGAHDAQETAKVHKPVSQNESKSKAPAGFY